MVNSSQTLVESHHTTGQPPERTTLATVAKSIAETLHGRYGVDSTRVLESAGLSPARLEGAGARCSWSTMQKLWDGAAQASGDPCFGLCVGRSVRPTTFHAVGFSWLASHTLLEALKRVSRYYQVISTVPLAVVVASEDDRYVLSMAPTDTRLRPPDVAIDAFMVAILHLCRLAANPHLCPEQVELIREDPGHLDQYTKAFDAPVRFAANRNALHFDAAALDAPLLGKNRDLALANDEIAERYLQALDPQRVSSEVRRLLIDLLPTGEASARAVAKHLNTSLSTLQRQLRTEHTSYRDLAEDTRRALAEKYVSQGQLSLSQIAYLLGFSDQSNFSRAFRRWTGAAPREFRGQARASLQGQQ